MIYNYTKCESVIAKIMADLDSTEVQLRTSDIKEWIFEAVSKIGAPVLYILKESGADGSPILLIHDGLVPMPYDLEILDGVAYSLNENGPWIPVDKSTSIFNQLDVKSSKQPKILHTTLPHDPNNKAILDEELIVVELETAAEKLMTSQSQIYTKNLNLAYEKSGIHDYIHHPTYFIKPGWIVVNRPNGFIKLSYKAIATDERGYPLIPDSTSYLEAVYWYVVMKLTFPKFMTGKLGGRGVNNAGNVYMYTLQQWLFYRNLAYAEAMMPTADDMRNIKHNWNKMIPDYDSDNTFFKHLKDPQTVYNDYYYGY